MHRPHLVDFAKTATSNEMKQKIAIAESWVGVKPANMCIGDDVRVWWRGYGGKVWWQGCDGEGVVVRVWWCEM